MPSPVARYNAKFSINKKEEPQPHLRQVQWDYGAAMDLAREVISALSLDVLGEKEGNNGDHVFMLRHCAFNPDHRSNDAAVMVSADGKLKYHCFHNSCSENGWAELRELSGISRNQQKSAEISNYQRESASISENQSKQAIDSNCQHQSLKPSNGKANYQIDQRDKPIRQEVLEYIEQGSGIFNVFDLDRELCLFTREDKNSRASSLNFYKKQGLIIPVSGKRGAWRVVDKECKSMKLGLTKTKPLAIALPMGLHELCDIRPGNIIVVAGSPNAGKSAYVSNLVYSVYNNNTKGEHVSKYADSVAAQMATQICPNEKLACHFFSSEAGEDEMSSRLAMFPGGIESFSNVDFWERDRDFADVIRPNAINVIDFLEVYDDFYQIGGWINDIHRVLDKGIAVVVIQKKRGRDVGKGGDVTMEKPRLYISLENNMPHGGICKVVKAKFPKVQGKNPNGLEIDYKLSGGWNFTPKSDWRYVDNEKTREKINREYAAEASERGYMFNFITVEGEIKGLAKKDVETWTLNYPRIYVVDELVKIEEQSRSKPYLTSRGWFFELSGQLAKKNSYAQAKHQ